MSRRRRILTFSAVIGVTVLLAVALGVVATTSGGRSTPQAHSTDQSPAPTVPATAAGSARAFLDRWVDPDGRVVRRDQGGDTVSEGQAYGLLIALAARDRDAFARILGWTQAHLQRDDQLLSWRWADGAVQDSAPAADADLDAARALVLAGRAFGEPRYTTAGTRLATAVLDRLTTTTKHGRVLLPGRWAAGRADVPYNPSYASPAAFAVLGRATGDRRFAELEAGSRAVTTAILQETSLPPDWAQLRADGAVNPLPGPDGAGGPVRYGYDAARVALRYAESCDAADRTLASRLRPVLERNDPLPISLDLGGTATDPAEHPLAYAARAATRSAAGDPADARGDLERAAALDAERPTYYGAAWAALGRIMLTTDDLGGCTPGAAA
ncbi:glycosyl hydrolase family 8 [Tersicoccus sp. Bi-70]|uniref:glycosyl hydrolase family 8 n=1 Tax=Tersicoccus sp. Bi-70 TaxID=1897634 RepID=UPI0009765361|nr:glycosyl hydrolase family 8 [Tersicoccus sp. Bi-70]OMH33086.1 hypothetical protein BGP79_05890 [Tersicoccus sp. Bi-70]